MRGVHAATAAAELWVVVGRAGGKARHDGATGPEGTDAAAARLKLTTDSVDSKGEDLEGHAGGGGSLRRGREAPG